MNKRCFRLIFSKSLGFLIPVAETTRAQRKPGQTSSGVAAASSSSPFFSLKSLAASLLLAGLPGWTFAQLLIDPSAGGTHVISAPNGVPVIEIANPNGKGLSHNRFTEFDVVKPGVIFNNSQANGVSQLGGAILGNPNLQRQATAILSEVTGNKPSSISGTLEVFGGRADILIANPNGLSVNGVTTLNSSSLTLSTGRAQEVGGQLQLLVDQDSGQVVIGAEGVNTEGLSYFDIVARSVALQGAIGSKAQQTDIQIAAGQGTYDPLTGTFTAKPGAVGSGLAISGSAAGAMYGRYINLISSDSGAGVRHEGLILAAGDIHLSAAGDIELKDAGANGKVDISSTATLTNTGTVAAGKALTITAQDLINRKGGYLGSDGDLSIHALGQLLNEQGATLLATGVMTLNATQSLSNAGGIQAGGALQISTNGTLTNSGMVRSTGLTIKAGSLSNEQGGVFLSTTDASFTVKNDFANRSGAGIYAQQKLALNVTGAVLNNAATLAANSLVISAGSLTNQAAAKVLADAGLDLDIKNAVLNDNAVLAAKTLTIKAASLSNQNAAKLVADQSVTLNVVGAVVNNASTLASGNLLSIKSASLDNASSAILAGTTVTLDAADIRNRDSAKLQGTDVSLTASTRFSNESNASLQASNTLTLDTETFTVTGGEVLAGNDLSLNVGTYKNTGLISSLNTASLSFKNNANLVIDAAFKGPQTANLFTLNAHDVTITSELNSPGSVLIKATGDVRNQGTVIVGKSLGIEAKGLIDNAPGKLIWAGKNLYLDAGTVLTNGRDSLLMAMGDMALTAGEKVVNDVGRIEAQGDLSIDTPLLENLSSAEGGVSEDSQVKSDTRYTDTYRVFELQYYRVQVSLPTYKSTLSVQQGVVKAGGDLLLNQGTSKGKKATVRNVGGLMAATGNVLVDGNLENRGVSASKSLVDILRAARTDWRWSNTNGVIYPDGDWVQGTLYSFLDEYLAAGAESRWIKSLKKTSTPGLEQVLSAVLGADWKALEQDTLVQRWADFKANGSDKTQPYYADTQAEISAGQTFLQTGGTFENGDGSNWKEQTPITVKVGSKTVDSLAGELDAQFNLTRDGATDLLKQQLGSPLFQKRESSGDGQAFERVKPLYETRVKYLDQSQFLGSQYFLDKIGYDPQKSVTVLGDAYFDHQLIVQSVEQRVGNFYAQTQRLGGTALVKMLLDNGAALAATEGVSFGQPLTAAQVAALTSDVVWYENQVIDGQTVLAPKLYLSQKTLAARAQDAASSALVSADTVLIDADSVTNFNGTVRGNTDTFVYAKGDINNISLGGAQAGFFAGDGGANGKGPAGQLVIAAEGLVRNQGGVMSGFQQTLVGGKGILSSATTGYDETGALVVRDNGRLGMGLTPDVEKPAEEKTAETPAADPVAQTPPTEKTPLKVEAPKVREIFEAKLAEGPVDTSQGSSLSLIAGGDITLTSAITQADNVLLQTTGNLNLNDLHEARSAYAASHTQGFLSSVNVEERAASANSVGNVLTAKNLTIQAQKDLTITGGEINAQNSDIRVGGNSKVVAGKDLAFYEKAVTTKQLVIGAGVGAGGYEATGLWGTAPQESGTLSPSTVATASTGSAGSGSVRGDVNVGRAAASQELAKAGSTGATSGANKGRGGTNGANFKIGYQEVTTTDSTESVNYRNAQLNLGSGSVDVGGSLDIGGADINAGYQLSPEARAKMTPEQRAEASKNMPTLAISAGDIKTTKYEDSETSKHTREEFFAGYTAEAHSSVLDVAGNASNLTHKALGKDVVNDPDAPKGSSKTLANEQKAMEVDPALTALAAAGMATQLAFGEAAGVSSTYGIQHTQEEKETSSRSENINQIGGNISLTSTKGDIELNGVNLQGGKVAIKSAGNLTQRAAKSSTTSSESVQTHTAGLTGSAGVSPTGVGTGISVGASGNYDKTESSSTSYTNGLISGTEVSIETKGDHNLIGSNIKGNQVALKIGGNQTITSVQDTSSTDHTRGNWSASVGVAITTDGLIVPTASASGSGGKDYDDSKLVAEQAGIDADSLDLKVAGNLDLTGAHIVSKPGQGTVKVDGKITANTLHDSREKDGGYGGGGGGISKNGLPTATLEGGRVDQVHYQADNTATIDVGDPSKVTAGQGIDGKINSDASKQLNVTENRRVAGTDVKIEISVSDAKEIKAGVKKAFSPKAPKVHVADAPISRAPTSKKTTDVDTPKATPRAYVDSETPPPAFKDSGNTTRVKGYDGAITVNEQGRKQPVQDGADNALGKDTPIPPASPTSALADLQTLPPVTRRVNDLADEQPAKRGAAQAGLASDHGEVKKPSSGDSRQPDTEVSALLAELDRRITRRIDRNEMVTSAHKEWLQAHNTPGKNKADFDQRIIVSTDANDPTVKKAVDNLVAKHPDTSVVINANADGSHSVVQGNLKSGGTAKVEVVGHGDGLKLGGLDSQQISDVVQKLAQDNNTSIDKLALVGCGTACSKDGKSLATEVSERLLEGGNQTQIKGYDGSTEVNEQGRKQPAPQGSPNALGVGDPPSGQHAENPVKQPDLQTLPPNKRWVKANNEQAQPAKHQELASAQSDPKKPATAPSTPADAKDSGFFQELDENITRRLDLSGLAAKNKVWSEAQANYKETKAAAERKIKEQQQSAARKEQLAQKRALKEAQLAANAADMPPPPPEPLMEVKPFDAPPVIPQRQAKRPPKEAHALAEKPEVPIKKRRPAMEVDAADIPSQPVAVADVDTSLLPRNLWDDANLQAENRPAKAPTPVAEVQGIPRPPVEQPAQTTTPIHGTDDSLVVHSEPGDKPVTPASMHDQETNPAMGSDATGEPVTAAHTEAKSADDSKPRPAASATKALVEWIQKGENPNDFLGLWEYTRDKGYPLSSQHIQSAMQAYTDILAGGLTPEGKAADDYYQMLAKGQKPNKAQLARKHGAKVSLVNSAIRSRKTLYTLVYPQLLEAPKKSQKIEKKRILTAIVEWVKNGGDPNNKYEAMVYANSQGFTSHGTSKTLKIIKDIQAGGSTLEAQIIDRYFKLTREGQKVNLRKLAREMQAPNSLMDAIQATKRIRKPYYDLLYPPINSNPELPLDHANNLAHLDTPPAEKQGESEALKNTSSDLAATSNKPTKARTGPRNTVTQNAIFDWLRAGGNIHDENAMIAYAMDKNIQIAAAFIVAKVLKDIEIGGSNVKSQIVDKYYRSLYAGKPLSLNALIKDNHVEHLRGNIFATARLRKPYYDFLFSGKKQNVSTELSSPDTRPTDTNKQPAANEAASLPPAAIDQGPPHLADTTAHQPFSPPSTSNDRPQADSFNNPAPGSAANDGEHIDTEHAPFPLSPHLSDSAESPEAHSGRDTPPELTPDWQRDSDSPMDVDVLPDNVPPLLVKEGLPSLPAAPDSPEARTPPVIEVNDINSEVVDNAPRVKPEPEAPTDPQPTAEPVADASQEPSTADTPDAPVKEEVPALQHTINNAAPVLQGENGEDVLREVLQKELKLKKQADLKTLVSRLKPTFPPEFQHDVLTAFKQQGSGNANQQTRDTLAEIARESKRLLTMSNEERAAYMESMMTVVQTSEKGRGVVANRDIKAFEVIGPYAGKWLDAEGQQREQEKVGEGKFLSYAFAPLNKKAIISAFGEGHGNLTTLLNDADNIADNNVASIWMGKNLLFLVAKRAIPQGKPLLLYYGEDYDRSGWESHPIKVEPDEPTTSAP